MTEVLSMNKSIRNPTQEDVEEQKQELLKHLDFLKEEVQKDHSVMVISVVIEDLEDGRSAVQPTAYNHNVSMIKMPFILDEMTKMLRKCQSEFIKAIGKK